MSITVSIIIVHYKKSSYLYQCLQSIGNAIIKIPYEVIVVDNDENETIANDVKKRFPGVIYVKSHKNLGYGGGNNLGTVFAKGKYLFFLNPDTLLLPDTIDILVRFITTTKNAGCVAPLLLHNNHTPFAQQGSMMLTPLTGIFALSFLNRFMPFSPFLQKFWLKDWDKSTTKQVDVVPGTAFIIAKDVFEKLGKFDEHFFLFFEEYDMAKRIQQHRKKNYIVADAKVIHFHGKTTQTRPDTALIFRQSRFYFFQKYYGIPSALIVELIARLGVRSVLHSLTKRKTRV